ncbi:MAG: threonine ammonia-lyase, partial [Stackebrandtia sp.]
SHNRQMELESLDDVRAAEPFVGALAVRTPPLHAEWAGDLWLKPENLQPIGAFKIRGAGYAVARLPATTPGVTTHSSGNHGRALAYAARQMGIECVVVVPETAPQVKVEAMRACGAELVFVPAAERESVAAELSRTRGFALIPPYDHPDVIAGQGTIGVEILEDLPDVDTVLAPVGGGGLASGVAAAVKALSPEVRVIGVEPELAADAAESLHKGRLVRWEPERTRRTISDGVRTCLSELTFHHLSTLADDVVTVTDDQTRDALRALAHRSKLVAEPSGALTTAAYLHRRDDDWGRTVAIVSGGNIQPELLVEILSGGEIT